MTRHHHSAAGRLLALAGALLAMAMTLQPDPGAAPLPPSACLLCGEYALLDALLNVLLFVPLGAGLGLMGIGWRRALAVGALLSLVIELLQVQAVMGRDASLRDLLTNALGTLAGAAAGGGWRTWLLPTRREAGRLAIAGSVIWLTIVMGSAWAMRVSLPRTAYWGQWAPELLHLERFTGRLLDASAAGLRFPEGAVGGSASLRERLLADTVAVMAAVVPGPPTPGLAPIVAIHDWHRTQVLLLGQEGRDLVFTIRTRAADVRLRSPAVRVAGVFPSAPSGDDTLLVAGGVRDGRLWVRASGAGPAMRRSIPLGPLLGWSALLPVDRALGAGAWLIGVLWMSTLALPLGYWGARSGGRWSRPIVGLTIALGLAGAAAIAPGGGAPVVSAGATVIGLLGGWRLDRRPAPV